MIKLMEKCDDHFKLKEAIITYCQAVQSETESRGRRCAAPERPLCQNSVKK